MVSKTKRTLRRGLFSALTSLALLIPTGAHATLMIEIDAGADNSVEFTGTDGDAFDLHPLVGYVTIAQTVGGAVFIISAGSGAPNVGELFDINFLTTLLPNSTWKIRISDDSFMLGTWPSTQASSMVTPTTIGDQIVTVETRVNGQTVLASSPLVAGVNQSASANVSVSATTTIEHIIILSSGTNPLPSTSTFDTRTTVPEPGILGLFGLGLAGLAWVTRRV